LYQSIGITELLIQADTTDIKQIISLAKKYQMKVHAWIKVLNQPKNKTTQQHPDWYAVNRQGQHSLDYRPYVRYYEWLSPFHPDVRTYIKEKIAAYYSIEGLSSIHLDYIRYPDVLLGAALQRKYNLNQDRILPQYDYGYHPIARQEFEAKFGIDPLALKQPALDATWLAFRMNAISNFVNELAASSQENGIKLTAAVFPFPTLARQMVRQAWDDWQLDAAYPMLYHNFYDQTIPWIGFGVAQSVQAVDFPIHAGLFIPAFNDTETLLEAIDLAKAKGASGICFFTADHLDNSQVEALKGYIKAPKQ